VKISLVLRPRPVFNYRSVVGESNVANLSLQAGQSTEVEIESSEPLFIRFKTNASRVIVQKYFNQQAHSVRLKVVGVNSFVASVIGAGAVFPPVNGKIRFLAENETDVPLKVFICKSSSSNNHDVVIR